MRKFGIGYMAAVLLCAAPAFAQGVPPAGMPQAPAAAANQHGAMRACVMGRLPGLKSEMMAHMQQFRAANPGVTREARKAERTAYGHQMRQAHAAEIQSAMAACRAAR